MILFSCLSMIPQRFCVATRDKKKKRKMNKKNEKYKSACKLRSTNEACPSSFFSRDKENRKCYYYHRYTQKSWKNNFEQLSYEIRRSTEHWRLDGMQITSENRNRPASCSTGCATCIRVIHWQIKSRARSIRWYISSIMSLGPHNIWYAKYALVDKVSVE